VKWGGGDLQSVSCVVANLLPPTSTSIHPPCIALWRKSDSFNGGTMELLSSSSRHLAIFFSQLVELVRLAKHGFAEAEASAAGAAAAQDGRGTPLAHHRCIRIRVEHSTAAGPTVRTQTPARTQRPRMRTRVCLRAICASAPSAITHAWRLRMPAGCESRHALRRHHRWGGSLVPAGGRLRRASGANARSCKSFASLCACDTCMSTRGPRNFVCEYPHVYASPCARARDGALAHIACVRACVSVCGGGCVDCVCMCV